MLWLVLLLTLLQQRYDKGDEDKAIWLVRSYPAGASKTLGDELVMRGDLDCRARVVSSFRGLLDVDCRAGQAEAFRFNVDLVRQRVEARDPRTRALMGDVENQNRDTSLLPGDS